MNIKTYQQLIQYDNVKGYKQLKHHLNFTDIIKQNRLSYYTTTDTHNQFICTNTLTNDELRVVDSISGVVELIEILTLINKLTPIAIDYETTGLDFNKDKVKGIGLTFDTFNIYIVTDAVDRDLIISMLEVICEFKFILAHNMKFEFGMTLTNYDILLPIEHLVDTMTLAYLVNDVQLSLKSLSHKYLNRYPYSWTDLVKFLPNGTKVNKDGVTATFKGESYYVIDLLNEYAIDEIAKYCCEDTYACRLLFTVLNSEIERLGLREVSLIDSQNTAVASLMEVRGVTIDPTILTQAKEQANDLLEDLRFLILAIASDYNQDVTTFNVNSGKQLRNLLFNEMQLNSEGCEITATGNISVNEKSLKEIEGEHSIIEYILRYKKLNSLFEKFIIPMSALNKGDKIHPNINLTATATGRLSVSNPNFQQFPNPSKYLMLGDKATAQLGKAIRQMFIPSSESKVIVQADWSSMELVILAHLSGDKTLTDIMSSGKSLHDVITCKLFGLDKIEKNNPDHQSKRTVCKTINFGIIYGMTWLRLQRECKKLNIELTKDEAQSFIDKWFEVLPGVKQYFAQCRLKAIVLGYSETILGRKRFYEFKDERLCKLRGDKHLIQQLSKPRWCELTMRELDKLGYTKNPHDQSNFRRCQNSPIQGSNADAARVAMNEVYKQLVIPNYANLLMIVHDEFVLDCEFNNAKYVVDTLQNIMVNAIVMNVPCKADPKIAQTWGDCK